MLTIILQGVKKISKNVVAIAKIVDARQLTRIENYSENPRVLGVTM
jgi:hypothetical protein